MTFLIRTAGPSKLPKPSISRTYRLFTAGLIPYPPRELACVGTPQRPRNETDRKDSRPLFQSSVLRHGHHRRSLSTTPSLHSPTPSKEPEPLLGLSDLPRSSAPKPGLLLISLPHPPSTWPARLELASPLIGWLSQHADLRAKGIGVNVVYDHDATDPPAETGGREREMRFPLRKEEEVYSARLIWGDGKIFPFARLDSETIERRDPQWRQAIDYIPDTAVARTEQKQGWEILVCTHGARDCRCSDRGEPLVQALRAELAARGVAGSGAGRVKVTEIAHVGGHKYAPNALILPSFDMFSLLHLPPPFTTATPRSQRTTITDPYASAARRLVDFLLASRPPGHVMWNYWRGRAALTEAEQAVFWEQVKPPPPPSSIANAEGSTGAEGGTEVELRFRTWGGEVQIVRAPVGQSLLQVARANKLPAMEGTCGGNLECATCHLYLGASPLDGSAAPVDSPLDSEQDMLGYAIDYRSSSRLGCQIKVTEELGQWIKAGGIIGLPRF